MPDDDRLKQLHRQLEEVAAERDWLAAENRRLLTDLKRLQQSGQAAPAGLERPTPAASFGVVSQAAADTAVNQESALADKVSLFRSLFRGRQDVFARLWQSRQTGRVGYSPVCNHEWDSILCNKPRIRCGQCPNRDFQPVSDAILQNHLEGKHTVGVYPLLSDETCHLLAADFDKQSWMEDAAAFWETCYGVGVPAAIERSRSGNGAHVWIFFSEPVPASAARKLGCYLVTETMSHRHQLGMDSYDRLFPKCQPRNKCGNL